MEGRACFWSREQWRRVATFAAFAAFSGAGDATTNDASWRGVVTYLSYGRAIFPTSSSGPKTFVAETGWRRGRGSGGDCRCSRMSCSCESTKRFKSCKASSGVGGVRTRSAPSPRRLCASSFLVLFAAKVRAPRTSYSPRSGQASLAGLRPRAIETIKLYRYW
jgi:hypothetical protein